MPKTRKRSTIKKAHAAINAEANRLIKAGALTRPKRKVVIVGGSVPVRLEVARGEKSSDEAAGAKL